MSHLSLAHNPPQLGFGLMRMPMIDGHIDIEHVKRMADKYLAAGFNYFDTAWGYHDGKSEDTLRLAVTSRYPRERLVIATKMPIWAVSEQADVQRIFDTQLERTGAGYFDFYLIHAIDEAKIEKLDEFKVWDFIKEQKRKGLAKHIGFSFHDKAAVLEGVLDAHPEVEFVQLQINYADWDDSSVQARACYEACIKRGVAVTIMEPVKGGSLAVLHKDAQDVFSAARPDSSVASWAMRFCGSLDGVITVLSGMSNDEQMDDNIKTMTNFEPLTQSDRATLDKVLSIFKAAPTVPCTACKYCVEDCPQQINIPGIFGDYNNMIIYGDVAGMRRHYGLFTGKVKASTCIECGACEARCPQHIEIINKLKECAAAFE